MSRRRSNIWQHFVESTKNKNIAKCQYCYRIISISSGSSFNLSRHLRLKHPELSINKNGRPSVTVQSGTTFTEDEAVHLRVLFVKFAPELRGNDVHKTRSAWEGIAKQFNSTFVHSQRTIDHLKKYWKENYEAEDFNKTEQVATDISVTDQTNSLYINVPDEGMPQRRSKIWHHFTESKKQKHLAKCHYCYRVICLSSGSTGNLSRHLRLKHPELSYTKNRRSFVAVQSSTTFTEDEAVHLRGLCAKFATELRGTDVQKAQIIWEGIAKQFNSTFVHSQRTIDQLKKYWKEKYEKEEFIKTEEPATDLAAYVTKEEVDPLQAPDQTNVVYINVPDEVISEDEGVSTSESRTSKETKLHDLRMAQSTELFEAERSAAERRYHLEKELLEKRFDYERQVQELRFQYYTRKMRMEEELHEIKMRIKRAKLELLRGQVQDDSDGRNEADINDTGEVRNEL